MTKQIPNYLRLITDTPQHAPLDVNEDRAAIDAVCLAFEECTGWRLNITDEPPRALSGLMWSAPVNPGVGAALGHIGLFSSAARLPNLAEAPLPRASSLAAAVGSLWSELLITRQALAEREAELATGVPLVLEPHDKAQLGERLEAVLRGGAEAVRCQAAALYLLDSATSELKLRAAWGLPRQRFTNRARPLRGAVADLEALLGHAVVLADPEVFEYWKVPEPKYGACVCVPVSSPNMPLGTLWIYSRETRDFTAAETNLIEVVAGRLASDLERQILADEKRAAHEVTHDLAAAQRTQQGQFPTVPPKLAGWEIAAKAFHAGALGGTFYDWFAREDGPLTVVLGDALRHGAAGALSATTARSAMRALAVDRRAAGNLFERINSILWTGSSGGDACGLFQITLETRGGKCGFTAAGPVRAIAISPDRVTTLEITPEPLGSAEHIDCQEQQVTLAAGELLVVYGTSFLEGLAETEALSISDDDVLDAVDRRLAAALAGALDEPIARLAELAAEVVMSAGDNASADRAVLLIQRKPR